MAGRTRQQRPIRLVVRDDDLRAQPAHGVLPPLPRDSALRLGDAVGDRGVRRRRSSIWLAVLIEGEVPESLHDFVAELRPLRDAGERLRLPRGESVSVVPRPGRTTPSTSRSTRPCGRVAGAASSASSSRYPALLLASALGGGFATRLVRVRARGRRRAEATRPSGGACPRVGGAAAAAPSSRGSPSSRAAGRRAGCATSPPSRSATARRRAATSSC